MNHRLITALKILTSDTKGANWIKPSFKDIVQEIKNEAGWLFDESSYIQEWKITYDLSKEIKAHLKKLHQKGYVKDFTDADWDSSNGKLPPKEWLLDRSLGPKDWGDEYRYDPKDHDKGKLIPGIKNHDRITMPIAYDGYLISGRHRTAYSLALGLPVKVFVIAERHTDLVPPELELVTP